MSRKKTNHSAPLPAPRTQDLYRRRAITDPEAAVRRELDKCETAYAAGDKRSLAIAIQLSGGMGWPSPAWAVEAFNAGLADIIEGRMASWDDVLGGNSRTVKRLAIQRRNRAAMVRIDQWLAARSQQQNRIDDAFFEAMARAVKVSVPQARKLYYELPDELRIPPKKRRWQRSLGAKFIYKLGLKL